MSGLKPGLTGASGSQSRSDQCEFFGPLPRAALRNLVMCYPSQDGGWNAKRQHPSPGDHRMAAAREDSGKGRNTQAQTDKDQRIDGRWLRR